jgi:uncharacterized membrane protein
MRINLNKIEQRNIEWIRGPAFKKGLQSWYLIFWLKNSVLYSIIDVIYNFSEFSAPFTLSSSREQNILNGIRIEISIGYLKNIFEVWLILENWIYATVNFVHHLKLQKDN